MTLRLSCLLLLLAVFSVNANAEGDPAKGKANIVVCAACHGMQGVSPMPTYPSLAGQHERYLTKELQDIKSGKRSVPVMSGILLNLSDEQMSDMSAYFASLPMPAAKEGSGDNALGETIYTQGLPDKGVPACTSCHAPAGIGNSQAGFPALAGQHEAYLEAQLKAYRDGTRSADKTNIMAGVTANMTDDDMAAVASYLQGLSAH
ncbi:c-type cytochrome [Pokkaliibacter sp. CJK22405]|uniref:c-type cytochrome n=1 Tax=Pokkaliibacter sp. CJK22405 TaxID=3384615 RepID=UPI0039855291